MNNKKVEWIKFPLEDAKSICRGFQKMLDILQIEETSDMLPVGSGLSFVRLTDTARMSFGTGEDMSLKYKLKNEVFPKIIYFIPLLGVTAFAGCKIIKKFKRK